MYALRNGMSPNQAVCLMYLTDTCNTKKMPARHSLKRSCHDRRCFDLWANPQPTTRSKGADGRAWWGLGLGTRPRHMVDGSGWGWWRTWVNDGCTSATTKQTATLSIARLKPRLGFGCGFGLEIETGTWRRGRTFSVSRFDLFSSGFSCFIFMASFGATIWMSLVSVAGS